jgi:hypothetical protein
MGENKFVVFDVGGQRAERKKVTESSLFSDFDKSIYLILCRARSAKIPPSLVLINLFN